MCAAPVSAVAINNHFALSVNRLYGYTGIARLHVPYGAVLRRCWRHLFIPALPAIEPPRVALCCARWLAAPSVLCNITWIDAAADGAAARRRQISTSAALSCHLSG